ncbi:cyclic diguanylate phosphodiesterase [Buttiauxella selenatireducens]|uniref:cyclic-guanylate-specific phosphodiesterase n=1 Tax=Buttiauxella selenatireducens TaxID=3073902 RepID=A0ABY9SF28_9ENTR|nr:cyclic diguanylate phosphodiesterase [Buttiauxella sp. R73]WMY76105.1 cyclic diguanylate phosphodiesterase [Buttiauxella sp. R73]
MPFGMLKKRQFKHRLVRAILVGSLCILLGAISTIGQTTSNLKRTTLMRMAHAQRLAEGALDSANQAATAVIEDLGKECLSPVLLQLRMQVAYFQTVRSVNLVQGNQIYCSSLYGHYAEEINFDSYTDGTLYLVNDNRVKKDQKLIIYRKVVGKDSIVVRLYGDHILSELSVLSIDLPLGLIVGQQQWQHQQTPSTPLISPDMPGYMELPSTHYPFKIVAAISPANYLSYIWYFSRFSLIAWVLLSVIVGFAVFRWSGRTISPEYELRQALENQEFIPYIQPVVSGHLMRETGCEVLMRWAHPTMGIIPPDNFIPMAENCNLIIPMTQALMTQVRKQFAPMAQLLPKDYHFAFNITASHFRDFNLVEDCRAFINAFGDNPIKLVLELTERELLVIDEVTERLVNELHKLGVMIAIDDFGTGNSSLKYLQHIKVDALKIDKSFISKIGIDTHSVHIVDNIIDLAARLHLQTVAEGVENEEQASYLKARNVTFLQGYLYGKPVPMEDFALQFYD